MLRSSSKREPLQVVVRLRPLASSETGGTPGKAWFIEHRDGQQWVCHQGNGRGSDAKGSFAFDLCFDDEASNKELFDDAARKLVQSAVAGSNASILAYGQTSSGKTHSILGTPYEPGILPLAVEEIFGFQEDGLRAVGKQAKLSYYEIFNEKVTDLLAQGHGSTSLPVKEDAGHGFFVQGLREAPVYSSEDVLRLVARGEERRRYARTRWNDYSSRSHVIFTLSFEARGPRMEAPTGRSKLNIVDLAGCENHKHEASEDGRHINRSLFFLGEVISRLCKDGSRSMSPIRRSLWHSRKQENVFTPRHGSLEVRPSRSSSPVRGVGLREVRTPPSARREKNDFIPYRDSKLTRVLRSSLGGDALTLLLVTVHPAACFAEQSLTSLRFATKARSVDNYIPAASDPKTTEAERRAMSDAQRIIEGLQEKLRRLESRPRGGSLPDARVRRIQDDPNHAADALQKELQDLRMELKEKERELANKARLLSERDRQLGQLREQLDLATRVSERRHGPDAGGGLPVLADHWVSATVPEGLPYAGEEFDAASHTWPLTSLASRAEDIPCLRKSSFVMRQQALPERSPVSETQEELVEKLVKMAALQINTSKAQKMAESKMLGEDAKEVEQLVPVPSNLDVSSTPRRADPRAPRRGCPPGPPSKSRGLEEG